MDTLRVDICYRPLRIGWAIKSDDFDAFRKVVRYSHALWGGQFNPIIFVDHEEDPSRLIDLFRVDVIIPVGDSDEVKEFPQKFPHLIKPFLEHSIFNKDDRYDDVYSRALDIHNTLIYLRDKPEWKRIKDHGVRCLSWTEDDPLADVFLSQFGGYPDKEEIGTDYLELLRKASEFEEITLNSDEPISTSFLKHPGISYLSQYGIKQHYGIGRGWTSPGFYVGSVTNLQDLVQHWNLRACDVSVLFVDPDYIERYDKLIPAWEKAMQDKVANYRHERDRKLAVWAQRDDLDDARKLFSSSELLGCPVSDGIWNGHNVKAPMMYFGEASALGVMSGENSRPKVSFTLPEKPFCGDRWFHTQHLVASVSFIGGIYGDEEHTFHAPYLPELNEFYARTMHFGYDKLRIEPGRIGLVIDVADHDSFLYALPVADLMVRIFDMAGYDAELSNAGLITKQLITRLGGLQGGRVFKIPGVRRLFKTYGPNASIKKRAALQMIGKTDSDRPDAKFSDHTDLFIESRPYKEKLTPDKVFGYLVEKGLFRVGADLKCPSCKLNSWIPLDTLKHKVSCDLCGNKHDVTRSLTDANEWHYRRSGVLGLEKNAQGAVPVCLTLQQLDTNLHGGSNNGLYSPSLELSPQPGNGDKKCETDFVWVIPGRDQGRTVVVLAECKDQGPIDADDVENLKRIADSLPRKRFKTYIVLSQISPFTEDEIQLAKGLNDEYRQRVILLSANDLEPYHIKRRKDESGRELDWYSPEKMANSTAQIYFVPEETETENKEEC